MCCEASYAMHFYSKWQTGISYAHEPQFPG